MSSHWNTILPSGEKQKSNAFLGVGSFVKKRYLRFAALSIFLMSLAVDVCFFCA